MSLARARALAIVGTLVVAALVLVIVAIVKDKQSSTSYSEGGCAPGQVKIDTKLPPPSKIKLNVYNGTGPKNRLTGLAGQVADDFRNRGFTVQTVADRPQNYDQVAKLSYGPKAVAAAAVVQDYFLGLADNAGFDIKRTDDVVDITIGSQFKELGSKTEVNQKIAQLGNPSPPPGTCDSGA
jgi:hypothetical protein